MLPPNLLAGLTFSNELISRDEGLHTDFACYLYTLLDHKLPERTVHMIVKESVDLERGYCCEALSVSLIGMNANLMSQVGRRAGGRVGGGSGARGACREHCWRCTAAASLASNGRPEEHVQNAFLLLRSGVLDACAQRCPSLRSFLGRYAQCLHTRPDRA